MRKSRLSRYKQNKLIELFVESSNFHFKTISKIEFILVVQDNPYNNIIQNIKMGYI
ncbi:IS1016 transposase [Neisseria meningitidis]|uniref:Uncharacterized protein n=1 Tax=Neisseria meningitidis serogroup B / serotype 15 (strain H44/76) TaxID=909420 RepID=E6MVD8_NEIMH|nr:hypothetical protein N875_05525 [Neisseria meningitidis LNP21362]EFV64545.1 hypothetical protein NMH_0144 [Neisseria meningitidis H44/76]EJU71638.1 hypothetical protein NMEN2657_1869 [Neisseria meningitidis NM2657]ELK56729.1 hypothetical protein NMNM422_1989 [Neisseria meningitidis NM422]ELK60686.1 hypothetical protein NM87255_0368 [Neisseria meningitidis 87255]ELK70485.1 hypothetical protein NM2006087_1900 [Neisseria meningitidis 2006087]ELK76384.1 hypothetical protein NM97014_1922 [Neiss